METNDKLDQLFQRSKEQEPVASFQETQERFRESLNAGNGSSTENGMAKFLTLKNGLIMLSVIGVIITTLMLLIPGSAATNSKVDSQEATNQTQNDNTTIQGTQQTQIAIIDSTASSIQAQANPNTFTPIEKIELLNLEGVGMNLEMPESHPQISASQPSSMVLDTLYAFPRLTPDLIQANNKEKKRMLKYLAKLGKGKFVYIPSGTFTHDEKQVSVQGFYMQSTEVTVLEYRTFLFDLLIQKRKEDFLKAKPNQSNWTHFNGNYYEGMKPYEDLYFSHPAYDRYPVNNVSREGVEMYCKWITEEYRKWDKKGDDINDVRLPTNYEWVYAASSGGTLYPYPWGGPYATNDRGCFLSNFWIRNTSSQRDSVGDCGDKNYPSAYTSAGYRLGNGTTTAPVGSYSPNDFGLYNMSGNLAEMAYKPAQSNVSVALGGGWLSNAEEVKINSEENYEGITDAHINIGFRVVIAVTH